jgi:hypothetical protein
MKDTIGKPRCKWDNTKMALTERGWGEDNVDWIHLAQQRNQCLALVNMLMNIQVPQNA